jgi:hypothetical protein
MKGAELDARYGRHRPSAPQQAEDAEAEAGELAAPGTPLYFVVSLPAAAPRLIADHPGALPFLVACLNAILRATTKAGGG